MKTIQELNQQVLQLYNEGKFNEAILVAEQALTLAKSLHPGDHPDVATSLSNLATLYRSEGRGLEAENPSLQALEMRKRLFNGDHPDVTQSLNNLATLYYSQGRYAESESLYLQVLEITKRLFNGDHPDVAATMNNLGQLYDSQGRYADAEPLLQKALEIRKRLFKGDHSDVAQSLNNLALLYDSQGLYADAEPLFQKALEMWQRLFKGDHPDVATIMNNLVEIYSIQGRYAEAEPICLQALEMRKRLFNGDHPDVTVSLNTLASLYSSQARYAEAEHFHLQALKMCQRLFNGDHPNVAAMMNNLASFYSSQGGYTDAASLLQKALDMWQRLFNGDHPDVAAMMNNLGLLYDSQGLYADAEPLLQKALEIRKRLFTGDHTDVATSLNNLALLYSSQGRYTDAEPLFQKALEMWQHLFKGDHPDVATSLNNLAGLLAATNRPQEAFEKIHQSIEMDDRLIRRNFAFSSEQDRLKSLKNGRYKFDAFLSLVSQYFSNSPEQVQKALDVVLKRKSMTAAALAAFNFAIHSQRYSHLKPQFNRLRSLQEQLFHRTNNPPVPAPEQPIELYRTRLGEYQKDIAQLEQQCQQLEKELATQVPEIQLQDQTVDRRAVALELPANAVLVEYVRFDRYDFTAPEGKNWKSAEYWAFILPAEDSDAVQMISLGEAQPIDELIEKVRQVLELKTPSKEGKANKKGTLFKKYQYDPLYPNALREKIFTPLLSILQPYQNIFIAPDSQLSLIPFGVLPVDETGQQLLRDNYQISYLSSGKDVLRWKLETDRTASESLIIANPNFDYPQPPSTKPKTESLSQSGANSHSTKPVFHSLSSKEFDPLPETETLAKSIAEKLAIPNLYLGDKAVETLLSQTACPRILLIATHGYFQPESPYIRLTQELLNCPSEEEENLLAKNRDLVNSKLLMAMENQAVTCAAQGKENSAEWLRNFAQKVSEQYKISPALNLTENPLDRFAVAPANNAMIRAGLAFAGANTSRQGKNLPEDAGKGLLLAQDVAGIDLWENEVTILIACKTGLGDVQLGEGVFGLRRAFAVAGCKALIMSLWEVPTRPSLLLMDRFLSDVELGLGKREALLKAQSYIRTITIRELQQFRDDPDRDILAEFINEKKVISEEFIEANPDYQLLSHPYFWGAWISQGEM
ncbi:MULTISPECIES: CHAT domain-containing tetratricopeptide repeat protein [unclassified Microcoleus]|uniref:CHAT domain-containing tetratricopeptide repeat protein n=1 Tax=unclassified Microcoleus TaxID=2642155 RepID=UPI001D1C74AE|nr:MULTISPECIES: CHAT domain-containing tetratricopeptide repeat protein [unclassified Microcoleus]MCC3568110.1 CHAT domain-containing protein [Microcoleus sp. PH2017_31_RDM_U_A]MCC3580393.1 CHAT domain-containing protein [Microcoleus sp. PH2017_32_RDM_D_A]MCC3618549.1 CHAT domain-containing protein [Microcoleus sp. PH2017_38_RDM_U_B]